MGSPPVASGGMDPWLIIGAVFIALTVILAVILVTLLLCKRNSAPIRDDCESDGDEQMAKTGWGRRKNARPSETIDMSAVDPKMSRPGSAIKKTPNASQRHFGTGKTPRTTVAADSLFHGPDAGVSPGRFETSVDAP